MGASASQTPVPTPKTPTVPTPKTPPVPTPNLRPSPVPAMSAQDTSTGQSTTAKSLTGPPKLPNQISSIQSTEMLDDQLSNFEFSPPIKSKFFVDSEVSDQECHGSFQDESDTWLYKTAKQRKKKGNIAGLSWGQP
jgi:hypothetical protein